MDDMLRDIESTKDYNTKQSKNKSYSSTLKFLYQVDIDFLSKESLRENNYYEDCEHESTIDFKDINNPSIKKICTTCEIRL